MHTQEPWKVSGDMGIWIEGSHGELVACVGGMIRHADVRRIVACVNKLAGVPTEFLESLPDGALADVIEGIIQAGGG